MEKRSYIVIELIIAIVVIRAYVSNFTYTPTAEERQQKMWETMQELEQYWHKPTPEDQKLIHANVSTFCLIPHGDYELTEMGVVPINEKFGKSTLELVSWSWKNDSEVVLFCRFNGRIIAQWITVDQW